MLNLYKSAEYLSTPYKGLTLTGDKLRMNYALLTTGKNVSILTDGKELYSMFLNRIYNVGTWECISDKNSNSMRTEQRKETLDLLPQAQKELERMEKEMKKETPVPTPRRSSSLGDKLENIIVETLAKVSIDEIMADAKPMINQYILDNFGILPQKHEVTLPDGTKHEFEGITHEKFDDVLKLVEMNIPVFLVGQAGTGKNVICKQVAEALGLEFYFTNAVTQEYQIKGFIDANGRYHETQFYKAFTNGGLFFLDEMDGSIPETLIMLNSAIANGYFDFPTGKVTAHKDFRIISAGNTIGMGADIEYTGRYQLDASSLDRFALIDIDYSPKIEEALSMGNNELCQFARAFRKICSEASIRCLFTYRAIERIAKLEKVFPLPEVLKIALIKGLGSDDINIIKKKFTIRNKYTEAFNSL